MQRPFSTVNEAHAAAGGPVFSSNRQPSTPKSNGRTLTPPIGLGFGFISCPRGLPGLSVNCRSSICSLNLAKALGVQMARGQQSGEKSGHELGRSMRARTTSSKRPSATVPHWPCMDDLAY